jgi:hypothetical protein
LEEIEADGDLEGEWKRRREKENREWIAYGHLAVLGCNAPWMAGDWRRRHKVGEERQQGGVRWPSSSSVVAAPPAVYPIDARFITDV